MRCLRALTQKERSKLRTCCFTSNVSLSPIPQEPKLMKYRTCTPKSTTFFLFYIISGSLKNINQLGQQKLISLKNSAFPPATYFYRFPYKAVTLSEGHWLSIFCTNSSILVIMKNSSRAASLITYFISKKPRSQVLLLGFGILCWWQISTLQHQDHIQNDSIQLLKTVPTSSIRIILQ